VCEEEKGPKKEEVYNTGKTQEKQRRQGTKRKGEKRKSDVSREINREEKKKKINTYVSRGPRKSLG
jgi:hypothetical protein